MKKFRMRGSGVSVVTYKISGSYTV